MATQVTEYGRRVWKSTDLSEEDLAALRKAGTGEAPASWHHWRESTSNIHHLSVEAASIRLFGFAFRSAA